MALEACVSGKIIKGNSPDAAAALRGGGDYRQCDGDDGDSHGDSQPDSERDCAASHTEMGKAVQICSIQPHENILDKLPLVSNSSLGPKGSLQQNVWGCILHN